MDGTTRRALEVAAALVRSVPGALDDLLDVGVWLPGIRPRRAAGGPARLRGLLEELGTTSMKLGQVLSTRPDLVSPAYEIELARLQDAGPEVAIAEVEAAIAEGLGRSVERAFARFDRRPIAAASIGQVHGAALPDGTEVIVKVRRPGVVARVELDLALLGRVAAAADRLPRAARYDPVGLAREFATTLRAELDYRREAANAAAVATGFAGDPRVHVPRVIGSHSCASILTEERVRGVKIDDLESLDAARIDRAAVARLFADAYLTMVFEHGLYHADPHPGNVFVETSDRIGFVDFGMVGRVPPATLSGLGTVLMALAGVDAERLVDGLLALGVAGDDVDRPALARALGGLLARHVDVPVAEIRLGPVLVEVMGVVRAHRLRLPSDLALLLKTVMMCEGVAARLDPGFLLVPLLVPHATRLLSGPD